MTTSRLPVDAVVVTWNSRETALRSLEHLAAVPVERVILVDNASADGTAEAVESASPEVELVALEREHGLAAAYHRGADRGSAPLVLVHNDDVFVNGEAVRARVSALA